MADNDVQGQFKVMLQILQSELWQELWNSLHPTIETFESMGLLPEASDRVLWQACQTRQVILVTANRNIEGPDSLETTIRTLNQAKSLPVITLSNPKRFGYDRTYAGKVAEKLLDYLLNLEDYRGAGRLYMP